MHTVAEGLNVLVPARSGTMKIAAAEKAFLVGIIVAYAFFQRGLHETAALYMAVVSRFTLLVIEAVTLYLFFRYYSAIKNVLKTNRLLLLFSMLLVVSTLWSLFPAHTFLYGIHNIFTTLLALVIVARFSLREWVQILSIAFVTLWVLSLLAVILHPGAAIHWSIYPGAWRGIYFNKNGMGMELGISVVILLFAMHQKSIPRFLGFGGLALAFLLLWKSQSLTSQVAGLAVLAMYFALRTMKYQFSYRLLLMISLIFLGAIIGIYIADNFGEVMLMLGRDATMSNRNRIWLYAFQGIMDRPLLGYGFDTFWLDKLSVMSGMGWSSPHAHNHFLELFLDVGLIGGFMFIYLLYRVCKWSLRLLFQGHMQGLYHLLLMMALVMVTFTEIGIHSPHNILWLTFSTSVAYLTMARHAQGASNLIADSRSG